MKKLLSVVLACTLFISSLFVATTAFAKDEVISANINVTYCQTEARSMLNLVNKFRTGSDAWYWDESNKNKLTFNNLSNYTYDYDLEKLAMQRAAEIAVNFDHQRTNGDPFHTVYNKNFTTCGENIAACYATADSVFEAWREDNEKYDGQGHRRNMLSDKFTAIGIACVEYNGYYYWVQEFRNPVINKTPTAANNSKTNVKIDILASSVTSAKVTASSASYNLKCGDKVNLPAVNAQIMTAGTYPQRMITVNASASWSVSDKTVAEISGGKIAALKSGSASLTATVFGQKLSIPVKVSPAGKWIKSSNKWWYRHTDGSYTKNDWELIEGKWYHFDKSGWMQTGWLKTNNKWYYLNSDGAMHIGWRKVKNVWYYMNSSGAMQTGWQKIKNEWYYMNSNGAMQTGWQKIGGAWYYMNSAGRMQHDCWIGNYYVNSSGKWVKSR